MDRRTLLKYAGLGGAGALLCCGCKSAPMTGRSQLMLMPESQEMTLGLQAYEEVLAQEAASEDSALSECVQRVGRRIAASAQRNDFAWDFRLLAGPTQNAFCLPGGKVAVYEGILPICHNEAGLAIVMSHEIAHALARHGGERMSQDMAVGGAREVLDRVLAAKVPDRRAQLMQAYGLASKYGVVLPYNRKQESEADHIGVMLAADSGYDPREAPRFWTRFGGLANSPKTPEFLSTHPSDDRRARDLEGLMPQALARFEQSREKIGLGQTLAVS
jgi:predicted Zn-dependent protease